MLGFKFADCFPQFMSLLRFIPQIKAQIYEIKCISQHLEEGELQISDLIKKIPKSHDEP